MLRADAVMNAEQLSFEVGGYEMNDGHELFGHLRIAPLRDGNVAIAVLGASGVATTPSRMELGAGFALPHLDRSSHEGLRVNASPLAARPSSHPGFIDLNVFSVLPADPILIRAHHANAELVKFL